jgi:hypothetical protein
MTFLYVDMYGVLAREHQREMIEAAAEQRLVRLARASHPSQRRRRLHPPEPPRAA